MSNERIDLTQFEGTTHDEWLQNGWHIGPNLIAELKRCYDEIDDLRAQLMLAPYEEEDGYSVTCEACDKEWMIPDAKLLARFIKEGKVVREFAHLESSDCPSCVTAAHE